MIPTPAFSIGPVRIGGDAPLFLIAGPCVIEDERMPLRLALALKAMAAAAGVGFVFKASYDKANRMSLKSYRGPGLAEGLKILADVRREADVPVLTDVHACDQVGPAAEAVDVLQIPAFLSRQTDLVVEAARTGKPVNIKKGEFLSPWDMQHIADKARSTGNARVFLTERGTTFGYGFLVNDMRAIPIMQGFGTPVVFDAGHSVQQPGGRGGQSGGMREFIAPLACAAVGAGCDGVFVEVHEDPERALSDGPNMLPLAQVPDLLRRLATIHAAVRRTG